MAKQVPLSIKSGLPYGKTLNVTLPTPRDWWLLASDFEVLAQVREAEDYTSPLILDLTQFLTVTFDDANLITIGLSMSGSDTRLLTKSGYYDIIVSDPFGVDQRAISVLDGPVYRSSVVTGETEEITI